MAKYLVETDQGKYEVEVDDKSTPHPEKGLASKISDVGLNVGYGALETLAVPFELAGEVIRMPIEGDSNFRAPSILQRVGLAEKTKQPPSIGIDVANKLLHAAAGAVSGIPSGTPLESARAAYNADRGLLGAVEDLAGSLLMGKVAPQVMEAPMKALANVPKVVNGAAKAFGKKALRVGLGVSEEAQAARMNRPNALKNAKSEAQLAEDVARGHKVVESRIKDIESKVDDVLRSSPYLNEGAAPKDDILKAVTNARKKIGFTVTDKQKYAKGVLDRISGYLKSLRETVSERQQRDIIQKLDDAIPYGKQQYGAVDESLMTVRRTIDRQLKKNTAYRDLMKEEVPLQRLKKDVVDKFNLKRSVGEGFVADDTTASKMKTILGDAKEVKSQKVLKRLSNVTGQNYLQDVKDLKMSREFLPGERSRGSARTVAGGLMGMAFEPLIPGPPGLSTFIGGAAGRTTDYYGGAMAGKIIDALRRSGTAVGDLVGTVQQGARKTDLDLLLELAKRHAPVISAAYRRGR